MTNINATLPAWPNVEAAMADVREHGIRTGNEKMIVLAPDGSTKYSILGDSQQVQLSQDMDLRGTLLVHDHPVPVELSLADLGVVTAWEASGIIATMPDGSWSYAKGLNFAPPSRDEFLMFNLFGYAENPYFKAALIGSREHDGVGDHELGARLGNRALLDYLASHGYVSDYRLNLKPQAVQTFSGLRGLTL